MPPLVALKPHRYDGRLVRKGEHYTAQSDADATLLTAIGYSRHDAPVSERKAHAVEPAPTPMPAVQGPPSESAPDPEPNVVEEPEQQPESEPPSETPKPRRYRRKDMAAEG